MRVRTVGSAAAIISVGVMVAQIATMVVLKVHIFQLVIIGVITLCLCYTLARYTIKKFVIYRIKPIYQIVSSKDFNSHELEQELAHKQNMISGVEGELTNWAESNRKEIHRLKENEKYRKEFVGNVSHEIKTPIFNIQGYILTLLDGALEDETINRKYLERTEKSIDRLINIVTDLDQISKLESGVLLLRKELFDVVGLAKEIIETTELDAAKRAINVSISNYNGAQIVPIMITADKRYIGQVFVNLLTNSIKYGKHGGTTKISFIDLFDKIMIEVSDDGVGIAKEDIRRVFERFYRTDKSRSREQGGTGLGLSIVKHIIEAHHENITLRSHIGKGSTFSFTLSKVSQNI